jgi:hypothetical protein
MELEGDVLQIVKALSKEIKNWCRQGLLIEEAIIMLNSLQLWSVNHTRG